MHICSLNALANCNFSVHFVVIITQTNCSIGFHRCLHAPRNTTRPSPSRKNRRLIYSLFCVSFSCSYSMASQKPARMSAAKITHFLFSRLGYVSVSLSFSSDLPIIFEQAIFKPIFYVSAFSYIFRLICLLDSLFGLGSKLVSILATSINTYLYCIVAAISIVGAFAWAS